MSDTSELFQGVFFKSWVAKTKQIPVTWAKYGWFKRLQSLLKRKSKSKRRLDELTALQAVFSNNMFKTKQKKSFTVFKSQVVTVGSKGLVNLQPQEQKKLQKEQTWLKSDEEISLFHPITKE